MTSIRKLAQLAGLGLAAMGLVACGGGGSSSDGTGLMSLAVTDAPVDDAEKVVIRFTHVELQPADGGERVVIRFDDPVEETVDEDIPESQDGTLVEAAADDPAEGPAQGTVREIDLLALQGPDSEFLFEGEEVPAGDYSWIRFYLEPEPGASAPPLSNFATSSYIAFDIGPDGECLYCENLIIPGGLQAGLQLVSGFTVPEGGSVSFTVDFDLRNAIREDDQFEGYHRMRRALRLVDNSKVGVITGTVNVGSYNDLSEVAATCTEDGDSCPGLSVFVYEADDGTDPPLTTASVRYRMVNDGEYGYTVGFLSEGAYDLKLTYEGDDEVLNVLDLADDIAVEAGGTTEVDFTDD